MAQYDFLIIFFFVYVLFFCLFCPLKYQIMNFFFFKFIVCPFVCWLKMKNHEKKKLFVLNLSLKT